MNCQYCKAPIDTTQCLNCFYIQSVLTCETCEAPNDLFDCGHSFCLKCKPATACIYCEKALTISTRAIVIDIPPKLRSEFAKLYTRIQLYVRSHAEALKLLNEYFRWLSLLVNHSAQDISPSDSVDAVWHQHIVDTASYRRVCYFLTGEERLLDHYPENSEDQEKRLDRLRQTFNVYTAKYGVMDDDIWDMKELIAATEAEVTTENASEVSTEVAAESAIEVGTAVITESITEADIAVTTEGASEVSAAVTTQSITKADATESPTEVLTKTEVTTTSTTTTTTTATLTLPFSIFIKYLQPLINQTITFTLKVRLMNTVEDIKVMIYEQGNVHPDDQRIIFAGKQLEDGRTLRDYNVIADSTFHLVGRLRGC